MPPAAASLLSSTYRMAVVACLSSGPATPSTIADEEDVGIAHVSRALGNLREDNVVELLVDDDVKKGRVYALSDNGSDIIDDWGETIERNTGRELARGGA
ncbi:helix-turn-helix transcriptional regulator [Halosimplex rubrum]|uniref:Helix-turn-helix transcriptional regulator n=2 Tax=Halosimplex rubrum TaxID=869889 RepID=A0A7D5P3F3_9EURY|nr:helix-turn-helix transcriptional regulator [Halosimplex rubrum]QLH79963.1 helix-turn-helix transcriptional regulator [Halosimplex rubrum]